MFPGPSALSSAAMTPPRPPIHPAVEKLRGIDANRITPLQALALLAELAEAAHSG